MKRILILSAVLLVCTGAYGQEPNDTRAREIIEDSINYLRGETSKSEVEMKIHRPDWQRTMTITAWTRGREDSIFWIAEPAKDRGNGTLKKGQEMWLYNPKVNRVIKLPPSMMSQSWQGSDFSNNDLAKSDNIVDQYTHKIIGTEKHQDKKVYVIRSIPKPGAPVIWGMQELKIREDSIVVKQTFFDEDKKPVKILEMEKIETMGGRLYPVRWKMSKADEQDKYTVIEHLHLEFDISISDRMFTVSSLKHPKF